ncbi:MAG: acyl-CoA dehydrogenase family protein [Actinomycetota bacterium]
MNHVETARALGPRVRELAAEIEEARRLPPELADALVRAGWWKSCVPASAGGGEERLDAVLEVISELSAADASVGWCAMIGATSGLIYAYLDQTVAKEIVTSDAAFCTGGVFAPSGRAVAAEGGWIVSGRWSFASGVEHSTWLGLGVVLMDGDAPRIRENGAPDIRAVLLPASEVEVLDTWHVSGLRGTGSNDVVVSEVFVPDERVYRLVGGTPSAGGPLYAFPVFGLLALGVASVALGAARDSIHELVALATEKTPTGSRRRLADRAHAQMEVAQAQAELEASRAFVGHVVSSAWSNAENGTMPDVRARARLRLAATHATRTSARVVDRMYDLAGGSSIYANSRLQRHFRDVHAATQHMVISPATYELTGRVLLGIETDVSLL